MNSPADWHLERYRPLLRVLARRIGLDPRLQARFDSSDLVQQTLLKAHEHRAQFRGSTEPELIAWLKEILTRAAVDEERRGRSRKRDVRLEQSLQAAVADSSARLEQFLSARQSSPSQQAEQHELLLHLSAALEELPEDQRIVVIQRDLMGHAVADIAAALGRTEKSVAGLLLRGRRSLRESLKQFE